MELPKFVKEHPWTIAAVIGGGFVLYLLYSSSSGSSGGAVGVATVDPNVLAAETQLQTSQNALTAQTQQLQYGLAATENKTSADVAIATLQQQLVAYTSTLGAHVSLAGIAANRDVQTSGISSQTAIAEAAQQTNREQIAATENLGLANAAVYAHIADVQGASTIAAFQAQTAQAQIGSNTSLGVAQIQSNAALTTAEIASNAALTTAQIQSNAVLGLTQLNTNAQLGLAQIQSGAAVDIAKINSGTSLGLAQLQYGAPNYAASEQNLISAIQSTGYTGSGLLPQVQSAAAGGANAGVWATITNLVNQWASRTTSASNQAGKATILSALQPVTYASGYV